MKNKMEVLAEKLITNKIPEKLWAYLIVDFITKLPLVAAIGCPNGTFCGNNRRNIGGEISKIV